LTQSARFPLWGSTAVVAVTDADRLPEALAAVQATTDAFDQACSRFRPDSELSAVNRSAGRPVGVSPLFTRALAAGLRGAELTGGDVDPTVGTALIALGYDRDLDLIGAGAGPVGQVRVAAVPGWQAVALQKQARTVTLKPGVQLDLGATAKALAADEAATAASERTGAGVLVSLGGDMAIAGEPPAAGWRIRVTDDHAAGVEAPGQWITLRDGGLATSSTVARRWRSGDAEHHHVVDPGTGQPAAEVWRTASVTAASCLDANIASTAAIVRGARALGWLQELRLPARLVSRAGRVAHVAGWPHEDDDLPEFNRAGDEVPA
jgi:thiamine biosynthesis lipoprotein